MAIEGKLVHVVDDEDAVRRSLDFLLSSAGCRVEKWDSGEAFLKGADKFAAACALIDIRMPGMDGLALQREMHERGFNLPVIILTGHGDIAQAVAAMQAGAIDFIEKPAERAHILKAVSDAFDWLADAEEKRGNSEWARVQLGHLTDREREVLDGLACGYPNKTIAFDLGISARTVEVYRANVMTKLGVSSFADALRVAFAAGLGSGAAWHDAHSAPPELPLSPRRQPAERS